MCDKLLQLPVAAIVERARVNHPWQEYQWRACGVVLNPPPDVHGKVRLHEGDRTEFFAECDPLELHAKEVEGYMVNLQSSHPGVWIISDPDYHDAEDHLPLAVQLITVSAYEAQEYLDADDLNVDVVPLPPALHDIVQDFVAAQPPPEPFRKRRNRKLDVEEHRFGQEPIAVLRQRMGKVK